MSAGFALLSLLVSNILNNVENCEGNRIDSFFSSAFDRLKLFPVTEKRQKLWLPVAQRISLSLSNQQLLTGLASLFAGLLQIRSLSFYHFEMLTRLASISSVVHLIMLSMTRKYYWQKERRVSRIWQISLMVVMFAEIVACVIIRGLTDSSRSWEFPLPCLAAENLIGFPSGKKAFWMASELFLICYQYIFGILGLFQNPPKVSRWISIAGAEVLLANMEIRIAKLKAQRSSCSSLLARGLGATHAVLLLAVIFTSSECIGTIVYGVWIGWVLTKIFTLRNSVPPLDVIAAEGQMGFGQIVSLMLLFSTGRVLHEAYYGKTLSKEDCLNWRPEAKYFKSLDQASLSDEAVKYVEPPSLCPSSDASDLAPAQDQNAGTLFVHSFDTPARRRSFSSRHQSQT